MNEPPPEPPTLESAPSAPRPAEQPASDPPLVAPAPADAAPPPSAPAEPRPARPRLLRRWVEWFWRGAALSAAVEAGVLVPPRARELHRRARLAAELGRRALEPSGPLPHGSGDAVACELYREAVHWSLASLAVVRGEPGLAREGDLRALFAATDRVLLLQASPDPDGLAEVEGALAGASFVDFAEHSPVEQRELGWKLRRFVDALLAALDSTQRTLDRVRLQRMLRSGSLFAFVFIAIPIAVLGLSWSEDRRDIARGRPWKASSKGATQCSSPAQKCEEVSGYFFHTKEEDSPWLTLDLGAKKPFSEVRVSNRSDCCEERAVPLVIEVSGDKKDWKQVASRSDPFSTWKATFPEVKARHVRIRAPRRTVLHLSEVRVLR